jgi:hypothetical protein
VRNSRGVILLIAIAVGATFVAGLAIHGAVGGVLLLLVAALLVLLSVGVWGRIRQQGRPVRVLIAAAILGLAIAKFAGTI